MRTANMPEYEKREEGDIGCASRGGSRPLLMEAGSGLASGQEVGPSAILAGTAMDREG